MCSFRTSSSATYIPNVNQLDFNMWKLQLQLLLCVNRFAPASLSKTGIFEQEFFSKFGWNTIWIQKGIKEAKNGKKPPKLQVQTASRTFKFHVPSAATVLVWLIWRNWYFLLYSSTAVLFDDLKTEENMSAPSNTSQSIWKAKWVDPHYSSVLKSLYHLKHKWFPWFDVKH